MTSNIQQTIKDAKKKKPSKDPYNLNFMSALWYLFMIIAKCSWNKFKPIVCIFYCGYQYIY